MLAAVPFANAPRKRSLTFDVRFADSGSRLVGHAAIFNSLSEDLGGFRERVRPGAFTRSLSQISADRPVYALWNHDSNFVIASTNDGSLRLSEDERGLLADFEPIDTQIIRDLVVKPIRDGKVNKMSFAFEIQGEKWTTEDSTEVRDVLDADLYDVSPVVFPAYPTTDISARTLDVLARSLPKDVLARALAALDRTQESAPGGTRTSADAGAFVEIVQMRVRRHSRTTA